MEIIVKTIQLLFFVGLIFTPLLILRHVKKSNIIFKFTSYLTIGFIVTAIIAVIFAWWNYESNIILLKHYNGYIYNPDSGSYQVSYEKVLAKNISRVKSLENSHMGIGWPLKAIMIFMFYIPYLLLVYFASYLTSVITKRQIKKTEPSCKQ